MNEKMFLRMPFLMKETRITKARTETLIGKKGKIVQETKNTFTIKEKGKEIRIIKEGTTFQFNNDGQEITVLGDIIRKTPQDRLAMKIK